MGTPTMPGRAGAPSTSEWGSELLDITAYLDRLDYGGPLEATVDTLRRLHRAHIATIPFENLDIMLGRDIPIDIDSIQGKLVQRLRGGYCYEHNLLFAALLDRLGYRVTRLAGRIRMGTDKPRPRSHMLLRVEVDGAQWLADVGFGGESLLEPIRLADGETSAQDGWTYRLDRDGDDAWLLRSRHPDGWFDLYSFALEPHRRVDYDTYNYYTSTSPSSPFTRRAVAMYTEPQARHALLGHELTTTHPDGTAETRHLTPDELADTLAGTFSIVLEPEEAARLHSRSDPH